MKCPVCNKEMYFHKGKYFCTEENEDKIHKVVVLCQCGRRMIPEAKYIKETWTFWYCPHCHNRG